jgi:iron complex outermembrane receptor protein
VKTYDETLPFQHVRHYKAVWDQALNLGPGQLKAVVGYQQNQRQEYEESADDYELYFRLHTLTYDLRYLLSELPGWKLNAGAGGMWQRSENLGEEFLIPAYRLLDMGLYVTATRQLEMLTLSGGIRGDRRHLNSFALEDDGDERFAAFSRNFNGLTGSIGAVYSLGETMNVRLNVARGFRAPNMSELGSNGVHEGTLRYEIGNSQLKAEHSLQADLGADWSSPFVSAQVALFVNRISNFIFAHRTNEVMEEGLRTYRYTQGDARLMGFEASVDMHPVHRLHIGSTFSMVDARQLHQPLETRYLPLTPPARWTADVKYELTHSGHTLNNAYVAVGMECCLRQNHYYMADDTETATPSYTLLNMTAGTDVLVGHRKIAELYITVSNLTNRAYQSHLSRLKYCDVNPVTGRQGISNMGRNIILKLVVPIRL